MALGTSSRELLGPWPNKSLNGSGRRVELGVGEPGVMEHSERDSSLGEACVADPGKGKPCTTELGLTELGLTKPGMGQPGLTEPGVGEPGVAEPGVGEPGVGEPGVAEAGLGEASMALGGTGSWLESYLCLRETGIGCGA